MRLRHLIFREIQNRPTAVLTSLLAVALGVTAFVAIRTVNLASEDAVSTQLKALGANVLILPEKASLKDYYAADLNGQTLPEEHAFALSLANLSGVEKIAPKLCVPADLSGSPITLTGILPQEEFKAQAAWGGIDAFSNQHKGCKKRACVTPANGSPEALTIDRAVEKLRENEAILGADAAKMSAAKIGDWITLLGEPLKVIGILSPTGTVDDGRVFAHLHCVQRLAKTGEVVNAIEVMGCCEDVAGNLVTELQTMFPDTKIVTISQVVEAQVGVNRTMRRVSTLVFLVLVVIGGTSIASSMYANVSERRREVGTLMALGATPAVVSQLFLSKAAILGVTGGLIGALVGTLAAVGLGPYLAGVSVTPVYSLGLIAVVTALAVALAASYLPARRAALLDPCLCFKET